MKLKFKEEKGITLIALVVTIIVLIILAGIALSFVLGKYGLINRAKDSKIMQEKAKEKEQLELVLHDARIERETNKAYDENGFLNNFIKERIPTSVINENEVKVEKYSFLIDRQKLIIVSETENNPQEELTPEESLKGYGLIQKISQMNTSGNYEVEVNGKKEDNTEEVVKYNINLINYNGDLKLDGSQSVSGATLNENVYEFGNKEADVATETENARNMVVLKVNGNLTINEGITLTACKSDNGYGGPKGLLIYSTGTITNKGTISMTARGAKAKGENVFLWENSDGSFEYVPAEGAKYGNTVRAIRNQSKKGEDGKNGEGRQTRWWCFWRSNCRRLQSPGTWFWKRKYWNIILWRNSEEVDVTLIFMFQSLLKMEQKMEEQEEMHIVKDIVLVGT